MHNDSDKGKDVERPAGKKPELALSTGNADPRAGESALAREFAQRALAPLINDLRGRAGWLEAGRVASAIGMQLDQLVVTPKTPVLRKIAIPASVWGDADNVELRISVDKTFVPDSLSPTAKDSRVLGIRVSHAAIVPQ